MATEITILAKTEAEWNIYGSVIPYGTIAIVKDSADSEQYLKVGNGVDVFANLPFYYYDRQSLDYLTDANVSALINYLSVARSLKSADVTELGLNPLYLRFVSKKSDLPTPVSGVISLKDNTTYFITTVIDLAGDRIVCGDNSVILGGSSENCRIKSTGLASALITSDNTIILRNITLESSLVFALNGNATTSAIDWFGVNITDSAEIGEINNYSNIIWTDCAILNSGGLKFGGTIGTVGMVQCIFNCNPSNSVFTTTASTVFTRRFRIVYSSFVVLSGETGINFNTSTTVPSESYILDTVNFSGGGTYLSGVDHTSNKSLFINCTNITNTAVNGQLYMQNNATATTISNTTDFFKIAGTTTASIDNSKFTHSNDRLTCDAVISRKYLIQFNLSFTSGNSNVCEFGFYDSQLGTIRTPSKIKATANASGRAESVSSFCVITMKSGDYLEIHCRNTSATTNITVDQLNFIISEIK